MDDNYIDRAIDRLAKGAPMDFIIRASMEAVRSVTEAEDGCQQPMGGINLASTEADIAYEKGKEFLATDGRVAEANRDIDKLLPNFFENYKRVKNAYAGTALNLSRHQMPVINPGHQTDQFEKKLKEGYIDLFEPYAFGHPEWPDNFPGPEGESGSDWLELGQKDGDPDDDKIPAQKKKVEAVMLMPTQKNVWFDNIMCYLGMFGKPGSFLLNDRTAIVSKDMFLLDGHHRQAQICLYDPMMQLSTLVVPLELEMLIEIGKSFGAALGNRPNT